MTCFFSSLNQDNGYLVAADFEKAFDSVDHDFLFKVLELFGFGISICSWVKTLYTDISSCVMNGGCSTGYFSIERGVRQGGPSVTIFVFTSYRNFGTCSERRILKGFKFGEQEVKQVLYADDITLFVRDINSVNRLQYIFDEFEKISGLRINKEKTNFVWLGKEKDKPKVPLFGNLVHEIKILGVYFALDVRIKENH